MLAKLHTFSLLGIEAIPVDVEVDVSPGTIPKTILVGLPEAAVRESTHRVERAIVHCGFQRPYDRVVINLAPAELPKQAATFDLPITLGVLAGSGQLTSDRFEHYAVVGELSLEGRTRPAKGVLSMAMAAARQDGLRGLVVPDTNAAEAAVVEELEVIPVSSLSEAAAFFAGHLDIDPTPSRLQELFNTLSHYDDDYADVRGQEIGQTRLGDRGRRRTTCVCWVRQDRAKPRTHHDAVPSILLLITGWTLHSCASILLCGPPLRLSHQPREGWRQIRDSLRREAWPGPTTSFAPVSGDRADRASLRLVGRTASHTGQSVTHRRRVPSRTGTTRPRGCACSEQEPRVKCLYLNGCRSHRPRRIPRPNSR